MARVKFLVEGSGPHHRVRRAPQPFERRGKNLCEIMADGYIYSIASQRRVKVPFTPQLRARTKAVITQAFQIAARETPPPPLTGKLAARCPPCSLLPICLPEEIRLLQSKK